MSVGGNGADAAVGGGVEHAAPWHSSGSGKDIARRNREGKEEIMQKLPRYVRVNSLKCSFGEAKRALKETGHVLEVEKRVRNKNAWRRQKPDQKTNGRGYKRDKDVRELLVFHAKGKSDLSRVPLIQSGALIVQQKASCFPALALAPPPGSHVIDACAAPGSKTSHLAALMENRGVLFAFDRSAQRLENLRKLVAVRGASCVRPKLADFMTVDPEDTAFKLVTHILLDPSCSSSGMSTTATTDPTELAALVSAQRAMIRHAMRFPSVRVIVYSTCSVHVQENEAAVDDVIGTSSGWKTERALPWWERRGLAPARCADDVVRTTLEDRTIGFFVSRLVRSEEEPEEEGEEVKETAAVAKAEPASSRAAGADGGDADTPATTRHKTSDTAAELSGMTARALMKRAEQLAIDDEKLELADNAPDRKAAFIDLILRHHKTSTEGFVASVQPSHEQREEEEETQPKESAAANEKKKKKKKKRKRVAVEEGGE